MKGDSAYQYEQQLLKAMKDGRHEAFRILFEKYYADLVMYCCSFIDDRNECEDLVQDIFYRLWNSRQKIDIEISLKAFLLKSARNGCLDILKHKKIRNTYAEMISTSSVSDEYGTENYILWSDLNRHLSTALEDMDSKSAEAFTLNRFHNLKYKEIAERLGVSERTVEVRIGKALSYIRGRLADFREKC